MEGSKQMTCTFDQRDLCFVRGDTGRIEISIKDASGTPLNLTGATLFLTVKNALTDADSAAVIRKEVTSHTNALAGESRFTLATTDNATAATRYYDVQLKTATNDIWTVAGGLWKVLADVTARTAPLT
jgi:hypothetical protein